MQPLMLDEKKQHYDRLDHCVDNGLW